MTIREIGHGSHRYMWDTADTKPTAATHGCVVGDTGYDRQTGIMYITYDGTNWVEKDTIVRLETSSSVIGKVSEPSTVETPFTGTGNVAVSTHKIAPAAVFKLTEIELHLSAAPTTGTQNLVIKKDDGVNAVYDLNILTLDLVANAVTDLIIKLNKVCKSTDVITAAWTNTDTKTFGLIFKHQLV